MTKQKGLKTGLYFAAAFLQGACLVTLPAASVIFKSPEFNGLSDQQYGTLFLSMITLAILSTVLLPTLLRSWGRVPLFFLGFLCNGIYLVLLATTTQTLGNSTLSFWVLFAANAFLGAGFGFLVSILNLLVVDVFPSHKDGALAGLHGLLGTGAAVAPLSVNFFYQKGFWVGSVGLVLFVLIIIAATSFWARVVHEDAQTMEAKTSAAAPKGKLSGGAFLFLLVIMVYGTVEAIIGNWTSVYLNQTKSFSLQTASVSLSLFWAFMTLGRILTTFLTLKLDARILYWGAPVIMGAALFWVVGITQESQIIFAYMLVGLGCSAFFPLSLSLAIRYHSASREALASFSLAALMAGVGVGSFFVGLFRDLGLVTLHQAFIATVFCAVILFLFVLFLTFSQPKSEKTL